MKMLLDWLKYKSIYIEELNMFYSQMVWKLELFINLPLFELSIVFSELNPYIQMKKIENMLSWDPTI